jgi:hypothetical protein
MDKFSYDIDEVRVQVSKIEKEEGSQAIIRYMIDFFENNYLKFNHLISFLKILIPNMKRVKTYEYDEILTYVNEQIEKYPERNKIEQFSIIANILARISTKYAINYIEEKINTLEPDTNKHVSYFYPMITLSGYYKDQEKVSELRNRAISIYIKNENDLDFKTQLKILKTIIISVKSKDKNIDPKYVDFINDRLHKYAGNTEFDIIKKIAELLELVGIDNSINYIENYLNKTRTKNDFELLIKLSESYLKSNDYDKAFKSTNEANLCLRYFSNDPFMYLFNLMKIKEKQAEICIKEEFPKYDLYLIFSLESFALDIARDLMGFPHISGFYYRKKIQSSPYCDSGYDSPVISSDKDDSMDIAFKKLNIFQWRKEIIKEYLNFIYNDIPVIYGIFPKYDEESIKRIFDAMELDSEEWDDLVRVFPEVLHNKSITNLTFEINKFVTNLLKKYYDMGNHQDKPVTN